MEIDRFASETPVEIAYCVITTDFDSLAIASEAKATGNFHPAQTCYFTY
jgi:hypothetical protein